MVRLLWLTCAVGCLSKEMELAGPADMVEVGGNWALTCILPWAKASAIIWTLELPPGQPALPALPALPLAAAAGAVLAAPEAAPAAAGPPLEHGQISVAAGEHTTLVQGELDFGIPKAGFVTVVEVVVVGSDQLGLLGLRRCW